MASRPTLAEIDASKSVAGGWTRHVLAQWGVPWPPPKGWRRVIAIDVKATPKDWERWKERVERAQTPMAKPAKRPDRAKYRGTADVIVSPERAARESRRLRVLMGERVR